MADTLKRTVAITVFFCVYRTVCVPRMSTKYRIPRMAILNGFIIFITDFHIVFFKVILNLRELSSVKWFVIT